MTLRSLLPLLTSLGVLLGASSASAISYVATLLHPIDFVESTAVGVFGNVQFGTAEGASTHSHPYAALWDGSSASYTNLNPPGFLFSYGQGISATNMVGFGTREDSEGSHALLWSSDGSTVIDLTPGNYRNAIALRTSGPSQVGYVSHGGDDGRAILWNGSAASAVDLTPLGYGLTSPAVATDVWGNAQVGYSGADRGRIQALLWHGTAASFVNLQPNGLDYSHAYGVWETTQVGSASHLGGDSDSHAFLWRGTAASAVDLNPAGFVRSQAKAVSSAGQVGSGWLESPTNNIFAHALYWNGTAKSAVDLNPYVSDLLPDFVGAFAEDISEDGTIVGYAHYDAFGIAFRYAVMWTPVPEPNSLALAAAALAILSASRRTRPLRHYWLRQ